jgi:hypothetical protein
MARPARTSRTLRFRRPPYPPSPRPPYGPPPPQPASPRLRGIHPMRLYPSSNRRAGSIRALPPHLARSRSPRRIQHPRRRDLRPTPGRVPCFQPRSCASRAEHGSRLVAAHPLGSGRHHGRHTPHDCVPNQYLARPRPNCTRPRRGVARARLRRAGSASVRQVLRRAATRCAPAMQRPGLLPPAWGLRLEQLHPHLPRQHSRWAPYATPGHHGLHGTGV